MKPLIQTSVSLFFFSRVTRTVDRFSEAHSCLPKCRCTPFFAFFWGYPMAGAGLYRRRIAFYRRTSGPLRPWTKLAVLCGASVTLPRLMQFWARASSTWRVARYWSWSRLWSFPSTRRSTARPPWIPTAYLAILRRALSTATPTPTLGSVLKNKQQNEDDQKLSQKHCFFHSVCAMLEFKYQLTLDIMECFSRSSLP